MKAKTVATLAAAIAALFLQSTGQPASAADAGPADLVGALNGVFGAHPGKRAAHTKGFCLTGQFTPAPEAASLSKAPHFAKTVPVTARFSLGGGNPQASDDAKDNVRGFAVKFDLGGGSTTDIVLISAPVFFVQTPELFVEFLQTVGSGDKAKIDAFFAAHPESTRQAAWLNSHPVPASYAGVDYWGVHAFTFTNAKGETALVKYKAIPGAGELGLTDDEAKAKGDNFYEDEMKDRLAKGPVTFDLVAIRGKDGDQTSDPTLRWDDEDNRQTTPLGKISIDKIAPQETCDAGTFLPGNVVDGIAGPANDPVFQARSPAYILSFTRRRTPAQ